MNIKNAEIFINNILKEYDNDNLEYIFNMSRLKDIWIKLKNLNELNDICDMYVFERDIIEVFKYGEKYNINASLTNLKNDIKKCNLRYKILGMIINIYSNEKEQKHFNLILIDNKKKTIERFDTRNEISYFGKSAMPKLLKDLFKFLELDYKIINPKKFVFNSAEFDIGLCVPLSFLFGYLRIKYDLDLDKIVKLLKNYRGKDLFRVSNWFITYLYKNN